MTPRKPVVQRSPDTLGGTPVFAGTRLPVKTLIDYLEAGDRLGDFLQDFPTVTREQAVAALEIAKEACMPNEFTAVLERDGEWFIAYCPEVPGANGQGKTKEETLQSLAEAIALILEDRREEGLRGVPPDAILEKVTVR